MDSTRSRIASATAELHATIGPAQTTIKAVAERAGVQRHTVYSHFPDMSSLIRACTEHTLRVTGMPTSDGWSAIDDPVRRLEHGLTELYGYYRANSSMVRTVLRDIDFMLRTGGVEEYIDRMGGMFVALGAGWPGDESSQQLRGAAVAHALAFDTWRSFADHGINDEDIRSLMVRLVTTIEPPLAVAPSRL